MVRNHGCARFICSCSDVLRSSRIVCTHWDAIATRSRSRSRYTHTHWDAIATRSRYTHTHTHWDAIATRFRSQTTHSNHSDTDTPQKTRAIVEPREEQPPSVLCV